ncbi:MAG: hypothetical protein ACREFR_17610, partial [Limisphaerales bacterium]
PLGAVAKDFGFEQNAANMARVAIGLERYRLAHGAFPDSLASLAPQFLVKLPHDITNGRPLHYRRTSDQQFILYSIGWNHSDDGGTVALARSGQVDIGKGDWVWQYPKK